MNDNSQKPREYDVVLGGQSPPAIDAAVLGGIQGLRQQYISGNDKQIIQALSNALKYGEAGIDLLIEASDNSKLNVRATAYQILSQVNLQEGNNKGMPQWLKQAFSKLLQNKTQRIINKGIPLKAGDIIYTVYISAIDFDDDYYTILDSMQAIQEHHFAYDESPSFIKTFFLKEDAESFANEIHMRILEGKNLTDANWKNFLKSKAAFLLSHSDLSGFYRNFELQITDWCKMHTINFFSKINEDEFEFQEKIIQYLRESGQYQLLDELRELLGIGKFAFVHEETILEDSYLKITDNI
ncbi:hypothetical protein DSM106972_088850 [Dulcicalothrix desertica PCC 7102]|uniref:Uncharacterized protein n=1 Tax=Dulcicalothrix desertica PCC 7102 TaxID=232991 RepID=A0A3S1IDQ3_9CYAN|nr:hypothetical protein [Dulcicalothrix desertica]RUS95872.1 hypothetical protein DSM106972_088850 [Dulcicalothrix desertica PCC 7102]TWH39508.1 hypothetical protein CAL7102_08749 [Dulcicalothrix desertica PCC 7102]